MTHRQRVRFALKTYHAPIGYCISRST